MGNNKNYHFIENSGFLTNARKTLTIKGIENSDHDARYIISEILGIKHTELFIYDRKITEKQKKRIEKVLEERKTLKPLQYIFRKAYFRELELEVGPGTLIPRPETEQLASFVIENAPIASLVCDIGSGSGAVAVAIAFERPDLRVVGADISSLALRYCRKNAKKYGLKNLSFRKSNMFSNFSEADKFQFIVANLPYISSCEFRKLPREIRKFEPETALKGGKDGLDFIRIFIKNAYNFLSEEGTAIIEMDPSQKKKIEKAILSAGKYEPPEFIKDLNQKTRFCAFRRKFARKKNKK